MKKYLCENLLKSFRVSPFNVPVKAWLPVPLFMILAMSIGFGSGLFQVKLISSEIAPILPFTLFFFPSFLEEIFFRGVLIPREVMKMGKKHAVKAVIISTTAFVVWHPLNALLFNKSAVALFLDPAFLFIVAALGITCGYSYVISQSIWVPIIIHWATVTVWVFFLGGRNLILDL